MTLPSGSTEAMLISNALVIRRRSFVGFLVVVQLLAWAFFAQLLLTETKRLMDVVLVFVPLAAITYLTWLLAWGSYISLTEQGVRVVNGVRVHEFPWSALADVGLLEGLELHLRSGRVVRSLHFGRSLIGTRSHYPTYRQGCWSIARWWAQVMPQPPDARGAETFRRDGDDSYRWWVRVPVVPLLASVAGYGVLAYAYGLGTGLVGGG